jgi:hypothetical protein
MRIAAVALCMVAASVGAAQAQDVWDAARKAAGAAIAPQQSKTTLPGVTDQQASGALKEALGRGVDATVARLSKPDGFLKDQLVKILLPGPLKDAAPILSALGQGGLLTDLETRMNRGAELATPPAKRLFRAAIDKMTWQDAIGIVTGPQDAATQYLRRTAGEQLALEMKPIVAKQLEGAGATKAFNNVVSRVGGQQGVGALAGAVGSVLGGGTAQTGQSLTNFNMNDYVTNKAVDGIFTYIAKEEAAIRANPLKSGSNLIKTVFGAVKL